MLEAIRWRWPASVVIILTGYGTLESAMSAIQEGVDGYLLKPADLAEIHKTIDEAFRRSGAAPSSPAATPSVLEFADLAIDSIVIRCL